MQVFVPKETQEETRVAVTPETVKKFCLLGLKLIVETGIGQKSFYSDEAYRLAGATLVDVEERGRYLSESDCILRVLPVELQAIEKLKEGALHVSFLDPFRYKDHLDLFSKKGISALSLERIPRTTLAQKMDALSSQASLAGYVAILQVASHLTCSLPMMVTPAGTLHAARIFVIGAGVAGLQAIATAKRLGARIEAFDTRPEVEEQVQSLGAKFIKLDLGETGSTTQGYAKALTEEQLALQRKLLTEACARADAVITTAKVFGRKAPIILTEAVLERMRPGSVVLDLAVEAGGNVEGSVLGHEVVTEQGVKILGEGYWERRVATHASQVYAANLYALIEHFWNKDKKTFTLDNENDPLKGCLIAHKGTLRV